MTKAECFHGQVWIPYATCSPGICERTCLIITELRKEKLLINGESALFKKISSISSWLDPENGYDFHTPL
jgi:hypothetical protein